MARSAASLLQLHSERGVESATRAYSLQLVLHTHSVCQCAESAERRASGASRPAAARTAATRLQTRDTLFGTFSTLLAHILAQRALPGTFHVAKDPASRLRRGSHESVRGARPKTDTNRTAQASTHTTASARIIQASSHHPSGSHPPGHCKTGDSVHKQVDRGTAECSAVGGAEPCPRPEECQAYQCGGCSASASISSCSGVSRYLEAAQLS